MKTTKGTIPKNTIVCYAYGIKSEQETLKDENGVVVGWLRFHSLLVYWIDRELKYTEKLVANENEMPRFMFVSNSNRNLRVELHGPRSYTIGTR